MPAKMDTKISTKNGMQKKSCKDGKRSNIPNQTPRLIKNALDAIKKTYLNNNTNQKIPKISMENKTAWKNVSKPVRNNPRKEICQSSHSPFIYKVNPTNITAKSVKICLKYLVKYQISENRFSFLYNGMFKEEGIEPLSVKPETNLEISKSSEKELDVLPEKDFSKKKACSTLKKDETDITQLKSSSGELLPQSHSSLPGSFVDNENAFLESSTNFQMLGEDMQDNVREKTVLVVADSRHSPVLTETNYPLLSSEKLKDILEWIKNSNAQNKEKQNLFFSSSAPDENTRSEVPLLSESSSLYGFCDATSMSNQLHADKINQNCDNDLRKHMDTTDITETKRKLMQSFEDKNLKKLKLSSVEESENLTEENSKVAPPKISINWGTHAASTSYDFNPSQINLHIVVTKENSSARSSPVHIIYSQNSFPLQSPFSHQISGRDSRNESKVFNYSQLGVTVKEAMLTPSCRGTSIIEDGQKQLLSQPNSIQAISHVNQYFSVSDVASILHKTSDVSSPATDVYDLCSATSRNSASPSPFEPRKGNVEYLSRCRYENIGKSFITSEISDYVLQWNPRWFSTQRKMLTLAPICELYPIVKYAYKNEQEYYNTYICLLLTEIWQKMTDAVDKAPLLRINFTKQEVKPLNTKISCYIVLKDVTLFPKREDIVLCTALDACGIIMEMFGKVEDVWSKNCAPPKGQTGVWYDIRLDILCPEPLWSNPVGKKIDIQILYNTRLAELQNEALRSMSDAIKHIVMNPNNEEIGLDIVRYLSNRDVKDTIDRILLSILDIGTQVVLVDTTPEECDDVDLMAHLAYTLKKQNNYPVLVCLKSEIAFLRLARCLVPYEPVIAVRVNEMRLHLDINLLRLVLERRLSNGENVVDIYRNHPITLGLNSALSLEECRTIFRQKGTICILGEADFCTEVETALPIMYTAMKLIVLGKPNGEAIVPSNLKMCRYNITMFNRLYKFARK